MNNKEWLEELKVGDEVVALTKQYSDVKRKIVKVIKVTKKYIETKECKYSKEDGKYKSRECGSMSDWIEPKTNENLTAIVHQRLRSKVRGLISDLHNFAYYVFEHLDAEQLREVEKCLSIAKEEISKGEVIYNGVEHS